MMYFDNENFCSDLNNIGLWVVDCKDIIHINTAWNLLINKRLPENVINISKMYGSHDAYIYVYCSGSAYKDLIIDVAKFIRDTIEYPRTLCYYSMARMGTNQKNKYKKNKSRIDPVMYRN